MADKFDSAGFNTNQNYEIQIKNRGKNSGITYEFQEDLQRYIDEGIFVDELNNGFTNKEKTQLAKEFQILHEEKGYDTNFNRMKAGTTFTYTAEDYVRLAKAAGYVLKDMTPQEAAALQKQLEQAAHELQQKEQPSLEPEAPAVPPKPEKPAVVAELPISTGDEETTTLDIAKLDPVAITPQEESFTPKVDIKPIEVVTTPAEDDPFALSEDEPLFEPVDVKPVNLDDIKPSADETYDVSEEMPSLPRTFLKREGIEPEEFKLLPLDKQAELIDKYNGKSGRNIFARIFGGKKSTAFPPPDRNMAQND